jgi:transcriptional regulator with XRE-family HTH domain
MTEIPPLWRLMTGSALRKYREGMGYALEDAARVLDCCSSKISRVETGQRGIRPKELRELLAEYGVSPTEQATLLKLAELGRVRHSEVDARLPDRDVWRAAAEILVYDALQVPGLLQTSEYAQAIGTQALDLTSAGDGPRITAVISEGALRQMVGGTDIMRAQLGALADNKAAVHVLPFSCGALAAACGLGSLAVLQFADAPALDVARIGGAGTSQYILNDAGFTDYAELFGQLRESALSVTASAKMLRAMADALGPAAVTG